MRILALTFGDDHCASTKFRLLQYRPLMEAAGMTLEHVSAKAFGAWSSLGEYDLVILQKTLLKRGLIRRIAHHTRRFIYDVDDRTWLRPGKPHDWITRQRISSRVRQIAESADLCLAANGIIADDLREHGANPTIVPMALDGAKWHPAETREAPLTIGWTGSPASLQYLETIRPALTDIQSEYPEVRWQIHCGQDPNWSDFKYEHVPFVPDQEPMTVRGFHVGLLPLRDGEFARGKSPIKALQYFASGVALIHSPVGATVELTQSNALGMAATTLEDWRECLRRTISDRQTREATASAGREAFLKRHAIESTFRLMRAVLRK